MESLLEKISSYNIFNNLLPGAIFCIIADQYSLIYIEQHSILNILFIYYFVGLSISRFGSIVIEPILKFSKLIKLSNYSDYIEASLIDPKIEIISESNNMFRTILSVFICLLIFSAGSNIIQCHPEYFNIFKYLLVVILIILFGLSYIKQTKYINKRIENNINSLK